VLGVTFNSGLFIGYAALAKSAIPLEVVIPFYVGGVLWTIIYDTIYAFQDREFDKKLGLRSTAIEIEHNPHKILGTMAIASTSLFFLGGVNAGIANMAYGIGMAAVASQYKW